MAAPSLVSIVAGRWGTPGPHDWDDGERHTGVTQISLVVDDAGIRLFQAVYRVGDQTIEGTVHGTPGITERVKIKLDFPSEYITNVSGYVKVGGTLVVRSLTFKTNRATYGPYGDYTPNQDKPFEIPIDGRFRIVGFKGASSAEFLNAIGVHISK